MERTELIEVNASAHFSGPLPPPSLLAQYNDIIPNGAERIMAMAEGQSKHREDLESRVVRANIANQTRGSYFAFTIMLISILAGFYLLHEGKNIVGFAAIITALGGSAGIFLFSKIRQNKERSDKAEALSSRRRR